MSEQSEQSGQIDQLEVSHLSRLYELRKMLEVGVHLSRDFNPNLWDELEKYKNDYIEVFSLYGYDLRVQNDFAYFYNENAGVDINSKSKRLILLFKMIFDIQINKGKDPYDFEKWRILKEEIIPIICEKYKDIIDAEHIDSADLSKLFSNTCDLGFMKKLESGDFKILPPAFRYLEHCIYLKNSNDNSQDMDDMDDTDNIDEDEILPEDLEENNEFENEEGTF